MSSAVLHKPLSSDQILRIANEDAIRMYGDISIFRITIRRSGEGWHVEFDPLDPELQSGGPHYIIDEDEGSIVSKKYFQ